MGHAVAIRPVLAAALALCAACTAEEGRECLVGGDCPSGACEEGVCVAGVDGGGGAPDSGDPDAGQSACAADHDGVIERDEVPLAPGLSGTFRIASDTQVDTAGTSRPGGGRAWDLSGSLPGDRDVEVTLSPVEGEWFAEAFVGASYWAPLADGEELSGVFEITEDSLLLLGVVSQNGGATRTELSYEPPVAVMKFPLSEGSEWSTTSTVSGVASGVPSVYTESYDYLVDERGALITPYGEFEALRLRGELTRTVGALVTTSRSFLFVSECFGTVASVFSEDYESEVEFDQASEVRRLSP